MGRIPVQCLIVFLRIVDILIAVHSRGHRDDPMSEHLLILHLFKVLKAHVLVKLIGSDLFVVFIGQFILSFIHVYDGLLFGLGLLLYVSHNGGGINK